MNNIISLHPPKNILVTSQVSVKQEDASDKYCGNQAFVLADPTADVIDQASSSAQIFTEYALNDFQQHMTQQIIYAMERKQLGLGRVCEDCGKVIPKARLRAKPSATRCIHCQTISERRFQYFR